MNEQVIKDTIKELSKALEGEISFHICTDKFSTHKKIEIIYDRQRRHSN